MKPDEERLQEYIDPFKDIMKLITDKETANTFFQILNRAAMAAISRKNDIEMEENRAELEALDRDKKAIDLRCGMKIMGSIDGGCEKSNSRKNHKFVIID